MAGKGAIPAIRAIAVNGRSGRQPDAGRPFPNARFAANTGR